MNELINISRQTAGQLCVSAESSDHPQEGGILSGRNALDSDLSRFLVQAKNYFTEASANCWASTMTMMNSKLLATIIIVLSRFLHIFLRKLRQPRVIAEMLGGILLGPSALGNIPGFTDLLFPKSSLRTLNLVANIGLVFYLFLVGLELEPQAFFNNIRRSAAISVAGIVLPFTVGVACSYGLYIYLLVPNEHSIPFTSFLLFTGCAISITAFPVLARILTEKKLLHTPVGLMAISAAALNDATAWALLALVISIVHATNNMTALYVFLLASAYTLFLLFGFRKVTLMFFDRYLAKNSNPVSQFLVAAVFCCLFISAWITELIGIHAIFGAFLLGLVIPRGNNMAIKLTEKIEDVIIVGFLPLFFALSGLRTNIGLLNEATTWLWLFVVIAVACFGKLLGSAVTARIMRMSWRESFSIGVLMNTKGLVELIVLNIGYDTHVINDRIFLVMVVMALVTTFMTTPIISVIYTPKHYGEPGHTLKAKDRKLSRLNSSDHFDHRKISATEILPDSIKEPIKMLIYLDDLEPVPSIARLVWLFKPEKFTDDVLSFAALKVLEPSERSSSVMIASQIDQAVKTDPALNMINLFGTLINVHTSTFVTMSSVEDIGEEVNHISNRENCSLIVLPWNNRLVIGSILSSSPQEKIRNIINAADVPTAIFVPKPRRIEGGPPVSYKKVVVIFFGGPDDREALNIGFRIYRHGAGLRVIVLNVVYRMSRKLDSNMNTFSAMSSPDLTEKIFPSELHPVTHHESISTVHAKSSNVLTPHPAAIRSAADEDLLKMVRSVMKLKQNSSTLELIDLESEDVIETAVEECLTRQPDLCIFGHKQNFAPMSDLQGFVNEVISGSGSSLNTMERPVSPSAMSDPEALKIGIDKRKVSAIDLEKQNGKSQSHNKNPISPKLARIMMHRSISHSSNLTPNLNNDATAENDHHHGAMATQAASNFGHFYASIKRRKTQSTAAIKKCSIVTEILGYFGEQLYDSDLNSSLLVISKNHFHST